jgi:hypothetical protein
MPNAGKYPEKNLYKTNYRAFLTACGHHPEATLEKHR